MIKMTEEDTFRRLKRIPFVEMDKIWLESCMKVSKQNVEQIFLNHGWTSDEYWDEATPITGIDYYDRR